jgi:hypothetical protein
MPPPLIGATTYKLSLPTAFSLTKRLGSFLLVSSINQFGNSAKATPLNASYKGYNSTQYGVQEAGMAKELLNGLVKRQVEGSSGSISHKGEQ